MAIAVGVGVASSIGGEPSTIRIEGEGVAAITTEDGDAACNTAIRDALRAAIARAAERYWDDARIDWARCDIDKLVDRYDVIEENRDAGAMHVRLAAVIRTAPVKRCVAESVVKQQGLELPRVSVVVQGNLQNSAAHAARFRIEDALREERIKLMPAETAGADHATVLSRAVEAGIDLCVIVSGSVTQEQDDYGLFDVETKLRAQGIEPHSGQVCFEVEADATAASDKIAEAQTTAAEDAAGHVAERIVPDAMLWWARRASSDADVDYIVELRNVADVLQTGRAFVEMMERLPGVHRVERVKASPEAIVLRVMIAPAEADRLPDHIAKAISAHPELATINVIQQVSRKLVLGMPERGALDDGAPLPTLAVTGVRNGTGHPGLDVVAEACSRQAESACVGSSLFRVVDRARLDTVMQEADLRDAGLLEGAEAKRIGSLLAAQVLVSGELNGEGTTLWVNLRLVRADTGQVLHTARVDSSFADRQQLPESVERALEDAFARREMTEYVAQIQQSSP